MQQDTGAVRYEFSGPGRDGWYATFTPDGRAFLSAAIFDPRLSIWPLATDPATGRRAPKPSGQIELPPTLKWVVTARVSAHGHVALGTSQGLVHLAALPGTPAPPTLGPLPGTGTAALAFTPSGRHLVALREGRLWTWALPPQD